jgi:hypothetical protein
VAILLTSSADIPFSEADSTQGSPDPVVCGL